MDWWLREIGKVKTHSGMWSQSKYSITASSEWNALRSFTSRGDRWDRNGVAFLIWGCWKQAFRYLSNDMLIQCRGRIFPAQSKPLTVYQHLAVTQKSQGWTHLLDRLFYFYPEWGSHFNLRGINMHARDGILLASRGSSSCLFSLGNPFLAVADHCRAAKRICRIHPFEILKSWFMFDFQSIQVVCGTSW